MQAMYKLQAGRPRLRFLLPALLFGLVALRPPSVQAEEESRLSLRVEGTRNGKGRVLCLLFAKPDGFPMDSKRALASTDAAIKDGVAVCEFRNVPPGQYAICGFHDENGNEELDIGALGIPKEGLVASRNAPMSFGPPKFKDAVFTFAGGVSEIRAKMKYYL